MLALQLKEVPWETVIVSVEIFGAMAVSAWMMYRKISRDVLILGGDSHTFMALSPLMQPRGVWSLGGLLTYRIAAVLFYVAVECYDIYRTKWKCLLFYTSWNFVLQGAYFAMAAWRTLAMWTQQKQRPAAYTEALPEESVSFLRANSLAGAMTRRGWNRLDLILDLCLATSMLIAVVVRTILYPYADKTGHPEKILNVVSYCQHALNVVVLQIDFVATRHVVSLDALPLLVAWPTVYCIFTWIVHGTIKHGFWPYPFLKLNTPWAPLWYGGLLFAHLVAFVVMLYLSKLKHTDISEPSPSAQGRTGTEKSPPLKATGQWYDAVDDSDDSDELLLSPRAAASHGHF